jgi:hypothetical protein
VSSVAYHADLKEVQRDPALARALADAASVDSAVPGEAAAPFDRLDWWLGLAQHCAMAPLLAVARADGPDDGRRAVVALPLARGPQGLTGLANWYSFRLRPLVGAGADGPALLARIARGLRRRAARVVLSHLPDDQGEAHGLARAFRQGGWFVALDICDTNHALTLNGRSYADYLAARPGPLRGTLKRKAKKVVCTVHLDWSEALWAEYEAVYAKSWKGEEGSMAFLKHFARAEAEAGRLRLGLARAGGQVVAAQLWSVEGGTAFIHKLAYAEEAKPLSPGTSLSAALFAWVIDRDRVAHVDFGTGDDPYKRDWMEEQRPRWRMVALDPRRPGQWGAIARQIAKALVARIARKPGAAGL